MFLSTFFLKRVKSKDVLVLMESIASKHKLLVIRERLSEKLEFIRFDPYIQSEAVYRERKKVKSLK
ncbi:39S ribosomal protein L33, mitochondrial isoform X3 [Nasonia vitripennis]|uniref:Large ribosomal subunit protein bL33m n=1 Tax=Nasonia vitripennis TaxID=7425 RepID=A0A7M7Q950_NASVI|nr:39S ribosomal protein L33, mitochondrial isoform X3 [Nasonia vitripennis]